MSMVYAHTLPGRPDSDWEPLADHLRNVAAKSTSFSAVLNSEEWGRLAGLWHDLGKYHPRFQQRLFDDRIIQPHAGAGAALAAQKHPALGLLLAWVIAGHHAGLANKTDSADGLPTPIKERIQRAQKEELAGALPFIPEWLTSQVVPPLPSFLSDRGVPRDELPLRVEFWLRMLFSTLVDADRLATEEYCAPEESRIRRVEWDDLSTLHQRLEDHLATLHQSISPEDRARPISRVRQEISEACRNAACEAPGLFALTVPTGGGKTLAAMRFALSHAVEHGLRRVIVVIPYTSIIEQNAARYVEVFGPRNVLEHHSNLDIERKRQQVGEELTRQHEYAAENWDAPIIVTTTVQFFESLFANNPSRCRKLHNIARSVIILDEVQSLPCQYLLTILDGLKQLEALYGCSIVLSTATPPALLRRAALPQGLEGVREIIADPSALASKLRRVRYTWPDPATPGREWIDLARDIGTHPQVLAITHRRADAHELAEELKHQGADPDNLFHLSALMCPVHRSEVLGHVRDKLSRREPCILISTQLIEAGVDVDFPIVYRALAGLDSIVQSAGRCNREGRLEQGQVFIYKAPTSPPPGILEKGMKVASSMLAASPDLDADDPRVQEEYFRRLYSIAEPDARNIQRERREMNFATVGRDFRMIEDGFTHPIIIPWREGAERLGRLRAALSLGVPIGRDPFRALQPFTVSVYDRAFYQALNAGAIEEVMEGMHALRQTHMNHYDERYGLVIGDDIGIADPATTIL